MNYTRLVQEAWRTTWEHRWLWVLGLFAGGAVGGFSFGGGGNGAQWRMDDGRGLTNDMPGVIPGTGGGIAQAEAVARQASEWVAANYLLLGGIAVGLLVLGIASLILAPVAQGAMAEATSDYAEGRATTLANAFRTGVHLFWRYVGLWVLLMAAAFIVAGAIAALGAAAFIGISAAGDSTRGVAIGVAILLGIPLLLALIAGGVAVSIAVAYAQRAIAHERVGPIPALREGFDLLRHHLRVSLMAWLLNVLLAIGSAIGIGALVAATVAVLGVVGAGIWLSAGVAAGLAFVVLAVTAVVAEALTLVGASNTFFWSYWTLTYLSLIAPGAPSEAAAVPA